MKAMIVIVTIMMSFALRAVEYTENCKVTDPLPLDGEYEISVASGVTVEYSGLISGTGPIYKTGAGTLVLSGAANTFSGGLRISKGCVRVDSQGAIGAGDVVIDDSAGTVQTKRGHDRQICFNAPNGCFDNLITISGYSPAGSSVSSSFIYAPVNTTLNGAITFSGDSSSYATACICSGNSETKDCTLTLGGSVSWNHNLRALAYGDVVLAGRVSVGTNLSIMLLRGLTGTVIFSASEYDIPKMSLCAANMKATGKNCFPDVPLTIHAANSKKTCSYVDLNGCDQKLASLWWDSEVSSYVASYGTKYKAYVGTPAPATLTLTGAADSRTSYQVLSDELSLVVDADPLEYPSFVQTLCGYAQTMSGMVAVSNGTLACSTSVTFQNAGELRVAEGGKLTVVEPSAFVGATNLWFEGTVTFDDAATTPFPDEIDALYLGSKAVVTLPSSVAIRAKNLYVDGVRQKNGTYSSLPQFVNGNAVYVDDGTTEITSATWTGGAGSDTSMATASNWSTAPDLPALGDGSLQVTFASGGIEASTTSDVSFNAVAFDAPGDFSVSGAGVVTIGAGGITNVAPVSGSRVYAFEAPVSLTTTQDWLVPSATTLSFSNGVTAANSMVVTKTGDGNVTISGDSTLGGGLILTGGTNTLSGVIATPNHVDQGAATVDDGLSLSIHQPLGSLLDLMGVTVEKPVCIQGYDVDGKNWFHGADGTTNVFKGNVCFVSPIGYVQQGTDSVLRFENGVTFAGTWHQSGGTVEVSGGRMVSTRGSGMRLREGTLRLETSGNTIDMKPYDKTTLLDLRADCAVTNSEYVTQANGWNSIDLNGFNQHFDSFKTHDRVTISTDTPATIAVGGTGANYFRGRISGPVGFDMRGSGSLTLTNANLSASTGDLKVSSGVLALAENASWVNGTNVTVSGTGTLQFGADRQLNRKFAVLTVDDSGVVNLQATAQKVKYAWIDGVKLDPGTYGGADAPEGVNKTYAAHFSGTGTLSVVGDTGLVLLFR